MNMVAMALHNPPVPVTPMAVRIFLATTAKFDNDVAGDTIVMEPKVQPG